LVDIEQENQLMERMLATSLLVALALGIGACSNTPQATPAAYGTAGGPLVAPTNPNAPENAGATEQKQENSGYYPTAGSPDVAAPTAPAGAGSTLQRQENSGYYPSAGSPDVTPSPSQH
jgi:hypothetical protein